MPFQSSTSTIRASYRAAVAPVLCFLLMTATPAAGQQTTSPQPDPTIAAAAAALQECTGLAASGQTAEAALAGKRAQAQFRAALSRNPKESNVLVGLARTLSQCMLPAADLAGQAELSSRAIELLQDALSLDSTNWTARFVLANIYLRSPSFTGRAPLAAAELDTLLTQQGDRTSSPMYARVFELRGKMLSRGNMPDSARALYLRGSRLFPGDSALRALADAANAAAVARQAGVPVAPAASPVAEPPVAGSPPRTAPSVGALPPAATAVETQPASTAVAALATVSVLASTSEAPPPAESTQQISRSQVLMTAGGTADIIQAVQMQPGATRVTEGSDVHTRGGGVTETALLVDGGRVPSLSRFEGLNGGMFGALDPFVVKSVRYSSGAFSAKHGNALSGILEIETDGRPRERQVRGGLSMAQMSATVRAPITPKVGAWASGRVAHTGVILATHGRRSEFESAPHSEEMVASVIVNPSALSELRATVLAEQDDAQRIVSAGGWEGPFHSEGAARSALLSSRWMPGGGMLVVRNSVAASTRSSGWEFGAIARERDERTLIARTDVEWAMGLSATLRGGLEHGRFLRTEHGILPTSGVVSPGAPTRHLDDVESRTTHLGAYTEAELAGQRTTLLAGVRADRLPGENGISLDPRVSISFRGGAWTGRLGGGLFHQGRWQLPPTIPDAGVPSGAAGEARHIVAGIEREGATTWRAEVFDKQYGDYAPLGAGPQITSARARGVDIIAQRVVRTRLAGWIGYSYLDAAVKLADGRRARSPYDVTHSATASATLSLPLGLSIGSTARYGTGAPITPVTGAVQSEDGRYTPIHGPLMSERLPAYARLDARIMQFIPASRFLLTSFVEVLNLTDRANTASVSYDATYATRRSMHSFFATRTLVVGAEIQLR